MSAGNRTRTRRPASGIDTLSAGPVVPLLSQSLAPAKLRGPNPRGARVGSRWLPLTSNKMDASAVGARELTPGEREAVYAGVTEPVENRRLGCSAMMQQSDHVEENTGVKQAYRSRPSV